MQHISFHLLLVFRHTDFVAPFSNFFFSRTIVCGCGNMLAQYSSCARVMAIAFCENKNVFGITLSTSFIFISRRRRCCRRRRRRRRRLYAIVRQKPINEIIIQWSCRLCPKRKNEQTKMKKNISTNRLSHAQIKTTLFHFSFHSFERLCLETNIYIFFSLNFLLHYLFDFG